MIAAGGGICHYLGIITYLQMVAYSNHNREPVAPFNKVSKLNML